MCLLDPNNEEKKPIESVHAVVASANDEVVCVKAVLKAYGVYASYDECIPVKMGRFTSEHGTAAAVKKFSGERGSSKNAKLKCRKFPKLRKREIKMQRKISVYSI